MKRVIKILSIILLLASFIATPAHAEWWSKGADGGLYTNTGNGLANAAIHVAACYIGTGTGTPCGGGGGGGVTIGEAVGGGTPKEVLYTDNSGNLFSDSNFTRDSSTQEMNLITDFGSGNTGGLLTSQAFAPAGGDPATFFYFGATPVANLNQTNAVTGFINDTANFFGLPVAEPALVINQSNNANGNQAGTTFSGINALAIMQASTSASVNALILANAGSSHGFLNAQTDTGGTFSVSDGSNDYFNVLNANQPLITFGDIENAGNGNLFILDDSTGQINLAASSSFAVNDPAGNDSITANTATYDVGIGDLSGVSNNTSINVYNSLASGFIQAQVNNSFIVQNPAGQEVIYGGGANHQFLGGDIDDAQNGTFAAVDDGLQQFYISNTAIAGGPLTPGFLVDFANGVYQLGANAYGNQTDLLIQDTTGTADLGSNTMDASIQLVGNTGISILGDTFNNTDGTIIKVDDPDKKIFNTLGTFGSAGDYVIQDITGNVIGDFDFGTSTVALGDISAARNKTRLIIDDSARNITFNGTIVQPNVAAQAYGGTANWSAGFGGTSSTYFNGSHSGTSSGLLLPTGTNALVGTLYTIDDLGLLAATDPITVDAGTGNVIVGTTSAQTYVMNQPGQSITLKKLTANDWKVE